MIKLFITVLFFILSSGTISFGNYVFSWVSLFKIIIFKERTWIFIGTTKQYTMFLIKRLEKLSEK